MTSKQLEIYSSSKRFSIDFLTLRDFHLDANLVQLVAAYLLKCEVLK
ncbi:MAG: hypothetical protein PWQ72_982 [Pseudothermotoga sp.]|nr:hypothetical protein [Pseudothermotoga sp.]